MDSSRIVRASVVLARKSLAGRSQGNFLANPALDMREVENRIDPLKRLMAVLGTVSQIGSRTSRTTSASTVSTGLDPIIGKTCRSTLVIQISRRLSFEPAFKVS